MKILVIQILGFCLEGTFNYEKVSFAIPFFSCLFDFQQVMKIAKDNADGISDLKVCPLWIPPASQPPRCVHFLLGFNCCCSFYYHQCSQI
jgi:hypothetical protein